MFVKVILLTIFFLGDITADSKFRVLAPEFICPKDDSSITGKPNRTIITLQKAVGADVYFSWEVRWLPLTVPTQRFVLLLWRAVRNLEKQLNQEQPEPNVYSIQHDELLKGVNYVFHVTAHSRLRLNGDKDSTKTFQLDNSQGSKKLEMVDGRGDLVSILLVGGQTVVAEVEFVLEAQIITCHRTQDYYFIWKVRSSDTEVNLDTSDVMGSRLVLPPYTFKPGHQYDVSCQVVKQSNGLLLAQTGLPIEVTKGGLEVYLSADLMLISIRQPFVVESIVINHDFANEEITYDWSCRFEESECSFIDDFNSKTLDFVSGLPGLGTCLVELKVSSKDQRASANITITSVTPTLPVIQIEPISRIVQKESMVMVSANVSNIAPLCTLTWFFSNEKDLSSKPDNDTCENCLHGVALSEATTIFSLEENFLNELTDYSNETEWRQVTANLVATAGRARFLADCACSATFDCATQGQVFADISFKVNRSPKPGILMVSPGFGVALETVFRISTTAAEDLDFPLHYTFKCLAGVNDTLALGFYSEHLAVETFLPFVEGGTEVWVEVCDRLGACSASSTITIKVSPNEGMDTSIILKDCKAFLKRCDFFMFNRIAVSAIVTFENSDNKQSLVQLIDTLITELSEENCKDLNVHDQFQELFSWFTEKKENYE